MSKVILFLALVLCLSSTTVFAQAKQSAADAELLEANKLTRDIVKLYGERKLGGGDRACQTGHQNPAEKASHVRRGASSESQRFTYLLVQGPTCSCVGPFFHSF